MSKQIKTRRIDLEYPYSHGVTLRRSGMSKAAWEYIVHRFGVTCAEPSRICSITIEGESDYGRLLISAIVEDEDDLGF